MNKKVYLLIIFVLIVFLKFNTVQADFEVDASFGEGEVSTTCSTGVCASTVYGYYGINVRLMKMSNGTLKNKGDSFTLTNKNFTFKKPKKCVCDDSRVCTASGNDLNYCWENYFSSSNFDSAELEKILKKMGTSLEAAKDYYLKIVPLVKIKYTFYSKTYSFSGTQNNVVKTWYDKSDYAGLRDSDNKLAIKYAHGFLGKDSTDTTVNDIYGYWNVLRNYYTMFKLDTGIKPYTITYTDKEISEKSAKDFSDSYSTSIYGKILIKISDYVPPKATITLTKVDANNTNQKLSGAEFRLYTKSGTTYTFNTQCTTNVNGVCKFESLKAGTYYLKESKVPKGYSSNKIKYSYGSVNSDGYLKIVLGKAENKKIGNVTNEKTCTSHFNSLTDAEKKNMKTRVGLYKLYGKTNLLNIDNKTAATACTNATCTSTSPDTASCLSASFTPSGISATNLSCYTNTITVGANMAYCQTSLNAISQVGSGPFSGKAGQMYITSATGKATKLTFGMKCYLIADNLVPTINGGSFTNYISNIQFDTQNLTLESNPSIILNRNGNTNEYIKTFDLYYYFKKIYALNGLGKIIEKDIKDSSSCTNCKFLGYGKYSKFSDDYTDRNMPFNFTLKLNKKGETTFSSNCKASVTPEIIIKDKLRLVFRPVNTNSDNLFLSKNASKARKPGANWNSQEIIDKVLKQNNNSYNKNKETKPKYKIILTSSDIKEIRNYNKGKSYDDYNLTCKPITVDANGEALSTACISNYLTTLKNKNILEINNSNIRNCFDGVNKNLATCTIE